MRYQNFALFVFLTTCSPINAVDSSRWEHDDKCVPGQQLACACPGQATMGAQSCLADGSGFGACEGCGGASGSGGASTTTSSVTGGGSSSSSAQGGGGAGGATGSGGAGGDECVPTIQCGERVCGNFEDDCGRPLECGECGEDAEGHPSPDMYCDAAHTCQCTDASDVPEAVALCNQPAEPGIAAWCAEQPRCEPKFCGMRPRWTDLSNCRAAGEYGTFPNRTTVWCCY